MSKLHQVIMIISEVKHQARKEVILNKVEISEELLQKALAQKFRLVKIETIVIQKISLGLA